MLFGSLDWLKIPIYCKAQSDMIICQNLRKGGIGESWRRVMISRELFLNLFFNIKLHTK